MHNKMLDKVYIVEFNEPYDHLTKIKGVFDKKEDADSYIKNVLNSMSHMHSYSL